MKSIIFRVVLIPLGLFYKFLWLIKEGTRDIHNYFRFKSAKIDMGTCIDKLSVVEPNVHILSNGTINNSKVSSYSYIGKNCIVQNTNIGKFCSIANDVIIGLGKHPLNLISTSTLFYKRQNTLNIELIEKDIEFSEYEQINIMNDVWIGARALIMDGVTIGNGAVIASNCVVTHNVPDYAIVAGVPAKIIKYRFSEEKIKQLLIEKWWDKNIEEIKYIMRNYN